MSKQTIVEQVESSFEKVEEIQKELAPAEENLETVRNRMWRMMGCPSFGMVRLGSLKFSRSMIVMGAAFGGFLLGSALFTPVVGSFLLLLALASGVVWIKAKG